MSQLSTCCLTNPTHSCTQLISFDHYHSGLWPKLDAARLIMQPAANYLAAARHRTRRQREPSYQHLLTRYRDLQRAWRSGRVIPLKIWGRFLEWNRAKWRWMWNSARLHKTSSTGYPRRRKRKNTRRDAWPDFYLMKMISIIQLTAGGLRRQSQQTITCTVQSVIQTNERNIPHNSKLALVLLPRD